MKIRRKKDSASVAEDARRENGIAEAAVAQVTSELRKKDPTRVPRVKTAAVVEVIAEKLKDVLTPEELDRMLDHCGKTGISLDDALRSAGRAIMAGWMDR